MLTFRRIAMSLTFAVVVAGSLSAVVAASAGAHTAYVASFRGGMISLDTVSGAQAATLSLGPGGPRGPFTITPDGRTIYAAGDGGIVPVDTGTSTAGAPIPTSSGGEAIAITPDGKTVLSVGKGVNAVTPISTATNTAGTPITVNGPTAIAITPDGATAYIVTAGKTLTPINLTTFTAGTPIPLDHPGVDVAITPDGTLALVAETEASSDPSAPPTSYVQAVDLPNGTTETPVATGDYEAFGIAVAPNGEAAYINESRTMGLSSDSVVLPFDIAARSVGAPLTRAGTATQYGVFSLAVSGDSADLLSTVPCNDWHCITGYVLDAGLPSGATARVLSVQELVPGYPPGYSNGPNPSKIVLAPSPTAGFTAAPVDVGVASTFDAGPSSDAGGTVTGYAWEFGDGSTASTAGPTVSHTYARAGTYTATLTTTNAGGCATSFVYTSRSAACTGKTTATTTRTVTVSTPKPPPPPPAKPATARTGVARSIARTAATVHGTLDIAGTATSWHVEYGTTAKYGKSSAAQNVSARTATVAVQETVKNLAPNTRYHYRVVTATSLGSGSPAISNGADRMFTTSTDGTVSLRSHTLTVRRGAISLPLRCVSGQTCRAGLSLTTRARTGAHRKLTTVLCGRAAARVSAGRTASARITLRATCRSLLRRMKNNALTTKLTLTASSGQKRLVTTVRLTADRPRS